MDPRYYVNLLIHLMNDGTVFLLPSVLPLIVLEYGFTYSTAGFVSAIAPFCLGVFQTPIGRFSDRLSNELLLKVGLLIVAGGSLLTATIPMLFIPSLFLIGIGGSFYHPAGYAYTSKIIKNSGSGTALGLQVSSGDLGTLVAFLTAGPIALILGWRATFMLWGAMGIVVLAISSFYLKGEEATPQTRSSSPDLSLLKKKESILIMILFAILGAISRILSTYLPTLFFIKGLDITLSDIITGIYIATGIVGGIISGRLADKYGGKKVTIFLFASTTLVLVAMYGISSIIFNVLMVAAVGIVSVGLYPGLYLMMRQVTSSKIVGTSYGLLLSLGMLSGIASITIGGYIIDIAPQMIYVFGALLALTGMVFSVKLPKLNNRV
jgi:FSR family fosmidomycin resistance protein-like MFS transporter